MTVVRTLESKLLRTTVRKNELGTTWVHERGELADIPFTQVPPQVQQYFAGHEAPQLIVFGQGSAQSRAYPTVGASMVLDLLVAGDPKALHQTGSNWARALNQLHGAPPALSQDSCGNSTLRLPRTLLRAQAWLSREWRLAADNLESVQPIREWVHVLTSSESHTIVHGHPGMAHWITTASGRSGSLLTGEDLGIFSPLYDVAWVLGEIAELKAFYPAFATPLACLKDAFLTQIKNQPTPEDLNAGVAFRLIQHAFDWHHYAGASQEQALLLIQLAQRYLNS